MLDGGSNPPTSTRSIGTVVKALLQRDRTLGLDSPLSLPNRKSALTEVVFSISRPVKVRPTSRVGKVVIRLAHNQEIGGSNPSPATKLPDRLTAGQLVLVQFMVVRIYLRQLNLSKFYI